MLMGPFHIKSVKTQCPPVGVVVRREESVNLGVVLVTLLKSTDQDISIEQSQLTVKDEIKDNKVNPVFGSASDKTSVPALKETYQETFSMTPHQDSPKTRPVIVNSKIPVLARFPGKKQNPEEIEMPPKTTNLRALSAQRHNTLPSFNARYSASQRRSSSHFSQENRILNMTLDKTNPENVFHAYEKKGESIDLQTPGFSHGQLYVACSRVGREENLFVHTPNGTAKNVVYHIALR
ncbi:TOG array regulator of axonemal microtubules protein 1 [Trichonephila clavipes]|nr:TOG array regulator of axonemal microtubules protein 1 [Trichonephila clavipes]